MTPVLFAIPDPDGLASPLAELVARWLPIWLLPPILAALLACAVSLYSRDRSLVPRGRGWFLTVVRLVLILILLVLLVDPAQVETSAIREPGELLVVMDTSRSMSRDDHYRAPVQKVEEALALGLLPQEARNADEILKSGGTDASRAVRAVDGLRRLDLARRALLNGWLDELSQRYRVSLRRLAEDVYPLETGSGPSTVEATHEALQRLQADGTQTHLGRPLAEEASRRSRQALAGIVLFTDGNHHAPGDPRDAARRLGALGVPVVAIGVGAGERPRDAAVLGVDGPTKVFTGDQVEAEITVETSQLESTALPLTILEGEQNVAETTVETPADGGISRFPVSFPAGGAGQKRMTVVLPAFPGEVALANNRRDFWLEVLSEDTRVLYLDGAPRWEYRRLKSTWERDENIKLDSFLVTAPPDRRLPQGFPRQREDLFAYDIVALGDVEPEVFTTEERSWLADFVRAHGGTLVIIAGQRAMPYGWQGEPLELLLPAELLSPTPPPDLGARTARAGPRYDLTAEGEISPLLRLVAGRQPNIDLWELLPAPRWFMPVGAVKPGAVVLAELKVETPDRVRDGRASEFGREKRAATSGGRGAPVFLTRAMGAGKVLFMATDSTWRWRRGAGDVLYQRFWGQVVRWAVSERLSAADGTVRLGTDRLTYELPLRVRIDALLENHGNADGRHGEGEMVDAVVTVRSPNGEEDIEKDPPDSSQGGEQLWRGRVPLKLVPRSGGRYRGFFEDDALSALLHNSSGGEDREPLECRVRVEVASLPEYNERRERATVTFAVLPPPDPEALDLTRDSRFLEELARLSGGTYLPLGRYREATRHLLDRSRNIERQTAVGVLDYPLLVAAVLIGLLALEWVLRKRWDLV